MTRIVLWPLNPESVNAQHRYLANLDQRDLLARVRNASGVPALILWEMVDLNLSYTAVIAGPETAKKLDIQRGEIVGYLVRKDDGQATGLLIGDTMVAHQSQAPPVRDLIGTLRWKAQHSAGQ